MGCVSGENLDLSLVSEYFRKKMRISQRRIETFSQGERREGRVPGASRSAGEGGFSYDSKKMRWAYSSNVEK